MDEKKDILISQFIDDELDIEEKINFVKYVHGDSEYTELALDFLDNERDIMQMGELPQPEIPELPQTKGGRVIKFPSPAAAASFVSLAVSLALVFAVFMHKPEKVQTAENVHRFVIHMPDAKNVALAGSFSNWNRLDMNRIGDTGYWEAKVPLGEGEYSYSFIVNDDKRIADPTVRARQSDGFGGENSVLSIGDRI
ncbi:glycogen-binding domain-containing protein [Limisalsivibrio acetivorans]|uniref:glycogen-binding domain-containing protein n=1 Tax=Limisalsivibrio acetivorans TaxID=1304888 RepID=UPI0003B31008|nr:glycogen-binding domain-containing protein [Limisalsivibrio acetivorans]